MGTWDTSLKGNDTFQDVHAAFLERYAEGQDVKEITKALQEEFAAEFSDADDSHPALFALAFAQWEIQSLDPKIYEEVKAIIETGKDLELWKGSGVDQNTLKRREAALRRFLKQLSIERAKPRARRRRKFEFKFLELVKVTSPDGHRVFTVGEEYVNGKYIHTSGGMQWAWGIGSGVLVYEAQGRSVTAEWLSNQTLEVKYEHDLPFKGGRTDLYAMGDEVKVNYKPVKKL